MLYLAVCTELESRSQTKVYMLPTTTFKWEHCDVNPQPPLVYGPVAVTINMCMCQCLSLSGAHTGMHTCTHTPITESYQELAGRHRNACIHNTNNLFARRHFIFRYWSGGWWRSSSPFKMRATIKLHAWHLSCTAYCIASIFKQRRTGMLGCGHGLLQSALTLSRLLGWNWEVQAWHLSVATERLGCWNLSLDNQFKRKS